MIAMPAKENATGNPKSSTKIAAANISKSKYSIIFLLLNF